MEWLDQQLGSWNGTKLGHLHVSDSYVAWSGSGDSGSGIRIYSWWMNWLFGTLDQPWCRRRGLVLPHLYVQGLVDFPWPNPFWGLDGRWCAGEELRPKEGTEEELLLVSEMNKNFKIKNKIGKVKLILRHKKCNLCKFTPNCEAIWCLLNAVFLHFQGLLYLPECLRLNWILSIKWGSESFLKFLKN